MASPRTNFEAPSMAPKKDDSSSSALRRSCAAFSSMSPAERSASIAICLPGMASRVKRAATSAMRPEPLVMTTKFTMIRIAKTITPMTKLPPMTKWPNASMTWPAAAVPSWPCAEDEAGRGEVQRQAQHGRDQEHGREGRELERLLDEQRRHQDEHGDDDRDGQQQVEQQRRQREDEHHEDAHDAEGEEQIRCAWRAPPSRPWWQPKAAADAAWPRRRAGARPACAVAPAIAAAARRRPDRSLRPCPPPHP